MTELNLQNYKNRHSLRSKIARLAWDVAWLVLARWTPEHSKLFNLWRVTLVRMFGAKIGKECVIKSSCEIWQPWKLTLGDYVALSEHVVCYSVDKITIGSQTTVSREAFLCCASHDVTSPIMELTYAPITIGSNVWVAARAIVMPGRKVGAGAVVGTGAVVVADVEPWTVVGGNPARFIKKRELKDGSSEVKDQPSYLGNIRVVDSAALVG